MARRKRADPAELPDVSLSAAFANVRHFVVLAIRPARLDLVAVDQFGVEFDGFSIRKGTPSAPVAFIRGDATDDGIVDVADAAAFLRYLAGFADIPCLAASDANASGAVTVADAVFLLAYLFANGPPPPPPFPGCGIERDADSTGCTRPCAAP
jgi:hypothetical protein